MWSTASTPKHKALTSGPCHDGVAEGGKQRRELGARGFDNAPVQLRTKAPPSAS